MNFCPLLASLMLALLSVFLCHYLLRRFSGMEFSGSSPATDFFGTAEKRSSEVAPLPQRQNSK
jgi:hypothetical protein